MTIFIGRGFNVSAYFGFLHFSRNWRNRDGKSNRIETSLFMVSHRNNDTALKSFETWTIQFYTVVLRFNCYQSIPFKRTTCYLEPKGHLTNCLEKWTVAFLVCKNIIRENPEKTVYFRIKLDFWAFKLVTWFIIFFPHHIDLMAKTQGA